MQVNYCDEIYRIESLKATKLVDQLSSRYFDVMTNYTSEGEMYSYIVVASIIVYGGNYVVLGISSKGLIDYKKFKESIQSVLTQDVLDLTKFPY